MLEKKLVERLSPLQQNLSTERFLSPEAVTLKSPGLKQG